ncbi:hypothetical protein EBU02_13555 [bacterium]|nr:hypothetical protein [bacterium]
MKTTHAVRRNFRQKLKSCLPFGIRLTKPKHFRDMLHVVWKNKDNLPQAFAATTEPHSTAIPTAW